MSEPVYGTCPICKQNIVVGHAMHCKHYKEPLLEIPDFLRNQENLVSDLQSRITQLEKELDLAKTGGPLSEIYTLISKVTSDQAVLVEALEKLARLGNGDLHGNSTGNTIAQQALAQVADSKEGSDG